MAVEKNQSSKALKFFRVLQDPTSFRKLLIPDDFARYLDNKEDRKATLFGPLAKFWHIDVEQNGCSKYLGCGWEEFVSAHELKAGDMVLFRYEGNMIFTVEIFSENGCSVEYQSNSSRKSVNEQAFNKAKNQRHQNLSGNAVKKPLTRSNKKINMDNASENSKETPRMERIMKSYNLTKYFMFIPKAFFSSARLSSRKEVILKNSNGGEWIVKLMHSGHSAYFSHGWGRFAKENNLEEGTKCVFKLVSEKVIQVEILKKENQGKVKQESIE